jgi:hypothetical protein
MTGLADSPAVFDQLDQDGTDLLLRMLRWINQTSWHGKPSNEQQ